jgi:anti-sigma regulatory factor (Ser/Thr protein kinase)
MTFARRWFAGDDLCDIESAVGEALANCAEHGYVCGSHIDISCRYGAGELVIEIKDAGRGFDRWNSVDFSRPVATAARGYGKYIMRRLMDEIEYADGGRRVRLVKRQRLASRGVPEGGWRSG